MKLNFGAGSNALKGWVNTDLGWADPKLRVDISKPLPYNDSSATIIFAEHVVEHVSPADAWRFLNECHRILRPHGAIRIAVPSIERVYQLADKEYLEWMHKAGFGEPTVKDAVANQIVNHGHLALWSVPLLKTCLEAIGFKDVMEMPVSHSHFPELRGVHGHGKQIGERNNQIETITVEGIR